MSPDKPIDAHSIHLEVPADVYEPGRTYGMSRAELRLVCPPDMTPERFHEIAAQHDAKVYVRCYQLSPQYGPYLTAEWVESGILVVLDGPVDAERGRRELEGARRVAA